MHRMVAYGLGDLFPTASTATAGQIEACGGSPLGETSYVANPGCWGDTYPNWQAAFYKTGGVNATNTLTLPAYKGAPTPDTVCTSDMTAQECADAVNNAQLAQLQADIANANPPGNPPDKCATLTANWPYPFDDLTCSTMILWGIGIAAGLFLFSTFLKGGR